MKITIIAAGKVNEPFIRDGIAEYLKRLKHYVQLVVVEVHGPKGSTDPQRLRVEESEALMAKIPSGSQVFLLDDQGKQYSSPEFAQFIEKHQLQAVKHLTLIIGGSYGFSEACYNMAHGKISLGKLTLPHQLARLVLVEQLYRAFTILKGESYHH